ncbi:hypothetical protein SprV_0301241100 [Sparganum proliferum]
MLFAERFVQPGMNKKVVLGFPPEQGTAQQQASIRRFHQPLSSGYRRLLALRSMAKIISSLALIGTPVELKLTLCRIWSRTVEAFVSRWVAIFGVCPTITINRDVQLESPLFQALLTFPGRTRIRTTSYHPTASNMVKPFYHEVKTALHAAESPQSWPDNLPLTLLDIRASLDLGSGLQRSRIGFWYRPPTTKRDGHPDFPWYRSHHSPSSFPPQQALNRLLPLPSVSHAVNAVFNFLTVWLLMFLDIKTSFGVATRSLRCKGRGTVATRSPGRQRCSLPVPSPVRLCA